ncbi:transcription factor TFIIIC subunit tfc4 [Coniothyrium glycines]
MNPNRIYRSPYLPADNRRYLPVAGPFSDVPPTLNGQQAQNNRQPYPLPYPQEQPVFPHLPVFQETQEHQASHISHPVPLIPLSAVQDLQEPPSFSGGAFQDFQDPFNRAYATAGPPVYEGFIPAPGREDEDDFTTLPGGIQDIRFESSDEDDEIQHMLAEAEEEEHLRQLEEQDDSELDADYSEEEAEQDAGDPDEMELLEDFEDLDERPKSKRGRGGIRGIRGARSLLGARGASRGISGRGSRGGRRGRPPGRGRGGLHRSESTRGKKSGQRGRPKGERRGPRAVADPGPEFRELQRQANDKFIAKEYEEALSYAERAIQLNPEIFDAYNIASEIYAAMGEEENAIAVLIAGAPTKRDASLWQFIVERIQKIDTEKFPEYTEEAKTAAILACLNQVIALDNNYEARSHKLEIEARLGRASKCVMLGLKMLRTRKDNGEDPDTEVLKIMAMMGTSSRKQTRFHLDKLIRSFEDAVEVFTAESRDHLENPWDWEMINIYLDLLDRQGDYSRGIAQTKILSRWKQGRRSETFWNDEEDDREFDIEDGPRRVRVPMFQQTIQNASYGESLPLEIRVKLGLFRLRRDPEDFSEAMLHLEMLQPDDHGPEALVWDYEDLFRIIADALHATGHDKDALRFYGPLHEKNSHELNLMSYIGLHTCYKNQGQPEKADQVIPILQKWPAENYDDLAILAKFFEDNGLWRDAMQRAETIYRDKYGHKLKNLNFQAYDELRAYYYDQRRKARGRYSRKKRTVERKQRMMRKATAQEDDLDGSNDEDGTQKELPNLSEKTQRPKKGLFRTKRTRAPKAQTFLPVLDEPPENTAEEDTEPRRTTLEGTNVPLKAIDQRFFRRKLENLVAEFGDDLTLSRAQHREIVSSFQRLDEISEIAEDGDQSAINEVFSITRELIEEFSTFDLFYANRKEDLKTYFRRIGSGDIWKESALMVLAVVANNVEDGDTNPELTEKPDQAPEDFWGTHFDKWCDAFGRYAVLLAREGDDEQCFATLDIAIQANVFHRSQKYHHQLQLCRLTCALAVDDSNQASIAARYLMKEYPFGTDIFRLYSAVNRLCSFPEGYSTGPSHKVLMRYIKTMDYALLNPEARVWYNFRNAAESKGGFRNNINVEDVDKVVDHDPALFALYGHVLMCGGSYMAALNYYFRAYTLAPDDPVVNLCIGVAYIQHAMKRLSENRQYQIQQGLAFVYRYYELRTLDPYALHKQEAEFNVGRMWHALGLMSLALPAYERCVDMRDEVKREAENRCEDGDWGYEDFATEAAFAMQSIYAIGGNFEAARKITEHVLVLE